MDSVCAVAALKPIRLQREIWQDHSEKFSFGSELLELSFFTFRWNIFLSIRLGMNEGCQFCTLGLLE